MSDMKSTSIITKLFALVAAITVLALLTGCIRSRVVITSEPPNAKVTFQKQERGETPLEIPFIWYWYYDVKLEKPGYQTLEKVEYLPAPPWFVMPLDFLLELMPFPIRDTHPRHYVLTPVPAKPAPDRDTSGTLQAALPAPVVSAAAK